MNKVVITITLILVLLFAQKESWSQNRIVYDTTTINTIHIDIKRDSTLHIQDSIATIKESSEFWNEYISSRKSTIGKTISRLIITPAKRNNIIDPTLNASRRFEPYEGMKISRIDVTVLPPYGISVYDTVSHNSKSLEWHKKLVNATHFKTSRRLITRQMTTKVGSTVSPFTLVQEEISLKSLRNIDDALIILIPDPDNDNSVIMRVICKDNFSWDGTVETDFIHSFEGEVANTNMFGLGQYVEYRFKFDAEKWKRCGNIFRFEYPNIAGTHIDAMVYYRNDDMDKILSIEFQRPFLTNKTKWAGGISFNRVYYSYNLPDKYIDWTEAKFNYRNEDIWAGHAIVLPENNRFNRTIHITGRIYGTNMKNNTDTISLENIHFYMDRLNTLFSIQYTSLKYYKGLQIFDLGRSEFVPTGFNIGIMAGYESRELRPSGYVELFGNYSYFNRETERYYEASITAATYLNSLFGSNRGLLKITANHISNPRPLGDFIYRAYMGASFTTGFKRYPNENLYITDNEIRGFKADSLFGTKKIGLSLGATAFSPLLKYDFRVAVGGFVDMGVIGDNTRSIFKSKSYFGVGLQLNIQNNYLLIKNLSIRLAYFPRVPQVGSRRDFNVVISNWSKNSFNDYTVDKPTMTIYK